MRLALRGAVAAATLIVLSTGVSVAGAVSGPGANSNSKFVYTEEVVYPAGTADTGNLIVNFDEGGQKRLVSVDYRLDASVSAEWVCGSPSDIIATQYSASQTVTGLMPDDKGRVTGNVALEVVEVTGCLQTLLRRIEYTDVTLTNLTTGHLYRLEPINQDYPT